MGKKKFNLKSLIHVVIVAVTILFILGCVDAVMRSFQPKGTVEFHQTMAEESFKFAEQQHKAKAIDPAKWKQIVSLYDDWKDDNCELQDLITREGAHQAVGPKSKEGEFRQLIDAETKMELSAHRLRDLVY